MTRLDRLLLNFAVHVILSLNNAVELAVVAAQDGVDFAQLYALQDASVVLSIELVLQEVANLVQLRFLRIVSTTKCLCLLQLGLLLAPFFFLCI